MAATQLDQSLKARDFVYPYPELAKKKRISLFKDHVVNGVDIGVVQQIEKEFQAKLKAFQDEQKLAINQFIVLQKQWQERYKDLTERQIKKSGEVALPWRETAEGQKLFSQVDAEFGNEDYGLIVQNFVADPKNDSAIQGIVEKWGNMFSQIYDAALEFEDAESSGSPPPTGIQKPASQSSEIYDLASLVDETDGSPIATKYTPVEVAFNNYKNSKNRATELNNMLNNVAVDNLIAKDDESVADGTLIDPILNPQLRDMIQQYLSTQTGAPADLYASAYDNLKIALGTNQTMVSQALASNTEFMRNASLVHLNEALKFQQMENDLIHAQDVSKLANQVVIYGDEVAQTKLKVQQRVESDFDKERQQELENLNNDPEWLAIQTELNKLKQDIDNTTDFVPSTVGAAESLMRQYLVARNNAFTAVQNDIQKYLESTVQAKLEWPEFSDPKFNLGIVQRMQYKDIGITPLPAVAPDATETSVVLNNSVNVLNPATGVTTTEPFDSAREIVDQDGNATQGSCDDISRGYRDYQKFVANYLFAKRSDIAQVEAATPGDEPLIFDISPYRGVLANWQVGVGKTKGAMAAIEAFFANYDERYRVQRDASGMVYSALDNYMVGGLDEKTIDLSNLVILWVPNNAVATDPWDKEILSTFGSRVTAQSNVLPKPMNFYFNQLWVRRPSNSFAKWNPVVHKAYSIDGVDISGQQPALKVIVVLSMEQTIVDNWRWSQVPTNWILQKLWRKNKPKDTMDPAGAAQIDEWYNDSEKMPAEFLVKLRRYSPFTVFDEVQNWDDPPKARNPDQKTTFENAWDLVYPFWSWSKVLALSATPINESKPDLRKFGLLVEFLKYFPDERSGKQFDQLFGSLTISDVISNDQVKATPEMIEYFSKFMSYISLIWDTTKYPYYNSTLCTQDREGSNICLADSADVLAADSYQTLVDSFKAISPDKLPGKPTKEGKFRKDRDWKYTVPNLIEVSVSDKSLKEINAFYFVSGKYKPYDDNSSPWRQGRLFDPTSFASYKKITPAEKKIENLRTPEKTVSKLALKASQSKAQFRESVSDVTGYVGYSLTQKQVKEDGKIENLKVLTESIVSTQPLIVGGVVGAREKGTVAFHMLESTDIDKGKWLFIQTTLNNEDNIYQFFWEPFLASLPKDIELFQGQLVTPATAALAPIVDFWWSIDDKSDTKEDLPLTDRMHITDQEIAAAIDEWYKTADKRRRVVYTGGKRENVTTARPLFDKIKKYWEGLFNHPNNYLGEYFQAILLGPTSAEGTSFKDIAFQVNLNPPQSIRTKVQSEGRSFRQCAHASLSWHHTQVTAEMDASGKLLYKLGNQYVSPGSPDVPNGQFPEVVMITMIATITPEQRSLTLMEQTPDMVMATDIFKNPDDQVDIFLRWLQGQAVDNLLFGKYSHVINPLGSIPQTEPGWSVWDELKYRAANFIVTSDPEVQNMVSYVKRFYRSIGGGGGDPGLNIALLAGSKTDPVVAYETVIEQLINFGQENTENNIKAINDIFAKLVYFMYRGLNVPMPNKEFEQYREIIREAPDKDAAYQRLREMFGVNTNEEVEGQLIPIGMTNWFKKTYYEKLNQERNGNPKANPPIPSPIPAERLDIMSKGALALIKASQDFDTQQDSLAKASNLALQDVRNYSTDPSAWPIYSYKNPGGQSKATWYQDSILNNLIYGKKAKSP